MVSVKKFQVEEWTLLIDIPKTKDVYEKIKYRNDTVEWLNYMEVCSFKDPQVLAFFNNLGIDILKPSQLSYYPVEEGTMMMYTGSYHLCGEIVEGEMDGWDLIIAGHCFSLTDEHDAIPQEMSGNILEISFEVVLPWILDMSIPAK